MTRHMTPVIRTLAWIGAAMFCLAGAVAAHAAVRLPAVFGDHMVLQRGMPVPVWGWADAGEKVSVSFAGQTVTATADDKGRWRVKLPAMRASAKGRDLVVKGSDTVTLHDVLVGEVWLCSGQSNMEFCVDARGKKVFNADQVVRRANHLDIRLINVPWVRAEDAQDNFKGRWEVCTPKTVVQWTAVGYFFAVHLQKALGVPVGLVESSRGGTKIQPWIAPAGWKAVPQLKTQWQQIQAKQREWDEMKIAYIKTIESWLEKAKAAIKANQVVPDPPHAPQGPLTEHWGQPTALYNGMIAPVQTYAIRGALWYQGESNTSDAGNYFRDLQALIGGWRTLWGEGDFPVILVQIAPWGHYRTTVPKIWEDEIRASRAIKNVGLELTMDIGNLQNIHPKDKQDVGKRLALWALANVYGQKGIVYSGPTYAGMKVQGDQVVVSFNHLGGGLVTSDGKAPNWFEVSGKSGKWHKADAKIQGDTVVVTAKGVDKPVAVRFAWSYRAQPNLKNKAGLPALPFDTAGR